MWVMVSEDVVVGDGVLWMWRMLGLEVNVKLLRSLLLCFMVWVWMFVGLLIMFDGVSDGMYVV